MKNEDFLLLKFGTIKSWCFVNSPESQVALDKYNEINEGCTAEQETKEQKELVCEIIDKLNGKIEVWWTDEDLTNDKEKAKEYIRNYCKNKKIFTIKKNEFF